MSLIGIKYFSLVLNASHWHLTFIIDINYFSLTLNVFDDIKCFWLVLKVSILKIKTNAQLKFIAIENFKIFQKKKVSVRLKKTNVQLKFIKIEILKRQMFNWSVLK